MSNKWKKIWQKKEIDSTLKVELAELINADGFDTGVGSYSVKTWRSMVADFCDKVSLKKEANVVEIGCGSGAFIYAANELVNANWYGVDYSESLINIAQKAIPNGQFIADEAINQNFMSTEFDVVFSHSVFQYFPSVSYAEGVLLNWCNKIRNGGYLVLMDINDVEFEAVYHSERMKAYKNPEEYNSAYNGLSHLFMSKQKLIECLVSLGMTDFIFFPHAVSGYGNSKFRFNLICKRK